MTSYRTAMCFVVTLGLASAAAMGQGAAGAGLSAPLPMGFRQQPAFQPDEVKTIDTWVAGQVQRLLGTDSEQQTSARDVMIAAMNGSPAYQDAYAAALNNAFVPVVKSDNFRARLNAAVVAARVADKVNNARLHDVAMVMIGDKNEGIAIWGLKTAKAVVPQMFAVQGAGANPDLIKAAAQAAVSRANAGPIVAEAYQVLAPRVTDQTPNLQALVKATFPHLMDLMAARNKVYLTGMPPEPTAETAASFFLSYRPVWNVLSQQEKVQAIQQISDLVGLAGQRWGNETRSQLVDLLQPTGKALQVIAGHPEVNNPGLLTAATALARVNQSTPAADVAKAVSGIHAAIKAVPAFASVTAPPTVQPMAAPPVTTAPAGAGQPAAATAAKSTQ